jgi:phage terminase small subunit
MDKPLTPKQEAFCLGIVEGLTQADAYRRAYDAEGMKPQTVQSKACILMTDGKIRARIDALRQPIVAKVQYGVEQAMAEAFEAYELAKEKGNSGAMVAAITLRAKLNQLLIEKREIDARHTIMPEDQRKARLAELQSKLKK